MSVSKLVFDAEPGCPFCEIAAGTAPAKHRGDWISTIIFEPLNPVTPGHVLVAPRIHIANAIEDSRIAADVMDTASTFVSMVRRTDPRYESVNFITSVGAPATQTVQHLHLHIVPRADGDGLHLPWTGQA